MKAARKPGPRAKAGVREKLLNAGMTVIEGNGYAATGISDIADAAEVAKGSFYHYFDSKETFGAAAADTYFENHWVFLTGVLEDRKLEPIERLLTYFTLRIDAFRNDGFNRGCLLGNLGLEVSDHSAVIRGHIDAHFQRWSDLVATCIEEAQRLGATSSALSANALGRHIVSSWEGAILRMRVEKSDRALIEFVEFTFNHLLKK
ncbi:TetR/AcrR family transcriptional regulator [Paraburkholderia guartelaensis]|uniref:TetR/AcrR family transcriptional regulator n=1 Tax=Paraburkholderia guartelaensis TaxID=2546446 RepID=UPI002AB65D7F|nr:TetR family transcriptional regulator C-terminal domain-containing protein [Paraburkholderia guartelaensis]